MNSTTILLVDDEEVNIALLTGLLKDAHTLVVAKNGPKALALAAQKPDLILLDIMMPGMDGYEVCRRLKANEQTKHIPVIFVASKREMADEADGLKIGAVDYIAKPIVPQEVKARVKTCLALHAVNRPQLRESDHSSGPSSTDTVACMTCQEIQAPIDTVVKLADGLLKDGTLSPEQRRPLISIRHSGFHALCMLNLSNELLAIERGDYPLQIGVFDLVSLVRNVRANFEPLIRTKRIILKIQLQSQTDAGKNLFFVRGDKMLCYALLATLLKRALEVSPEDQTVRLSMEDAGKSGIVRISDANTVPETDHGQFFEKEGRGAGAYIAKLLVETQGGKVRMRSDETKGTEIVFSLFKVESDAA